MWRLLHVIAIGALVASAVYVYSLKYQTIYAFRADRENAPSDRQGA